jgi:hypothetical protein
VQPRGEPDGGSQLEVDVAVAAGARGPVAELAGEGGLQVPAGVGGELRAVGVLADLLEGGVRPAFESGDALVAGGEDLGGDQPRAR